MNSISNISTKKILFLTFGFIGGLLFLLFAAAISFDEANYQLKSWLFSLGLDPYTPQRIYEYHPALFLYYGIIQKLTGPSFIFPRLVNILCLAGSLYLITGTVKNWFSSLRRSDIFFLVLLVWIFQRLWLQHLVMGLAYGLSLLTMSWALYLLFRPTWRWQHILLGALATFLVVYTRRNLLVFAFILWLWPFFNGEFKKGICGFLLFLNLLIVGLLLWGKEIFWLLSSTPGISDIIEWVLPLNIQETWFTLKEFSEYNFQTLFQPFYSLFINNLGVWILVALCLWKGLRLCFKEKPLLFLSILLLINVGLHFWGPLRFINPSLATPYLTYSAPLFILWIVWIVLKKSIRFSPFLVIVLLFLSWIKPLNYGLSFNVNSNIRKKAQFYRSLHSLSPVNQQDHSPTSLGLRTLALSMDFPALFLAGHRVYSQPVDMKLYRKDLKKTDFPLLWGTKKLKFYLENSNWFVIDEGNFNMLDQEGKKQVVEKTECCFNPVEYPTKEFSTFTKVYRRK